MNPVICASFVLIGCTSTNRATAKVNESRKVSFIKGKNYFLYPVFSLFVTGIDHAALIPKSMQYQFKAQPA